MSRVSKTPRGPRIPGFAVGIIVLTLLGFTLVPGEILASQPARGGTASSSAERTGAAAQSSVSIDWWPVDPAPRPSARLSSMAYSSKSDRVVLFGGASPGDPHLMDDTWHYDADARRWSRQVVGGVPPPNYAHSTVYDPVNDRVIILGGSDGAKPKDLMWAFRPSAGAWEEIGARPRPQPQVLPAIAFHEPSGTLVHYGGGETWTFDVRTDQWQNRSPAVSPKTKNGHTLAYDPAMKLVVLFGGDAGSSNYRYLAESWTYDPGTNLWKNVTVSPSPSARTFTGMATNPASENILLFGGYSRGVWWDDYLSDVWSYDGRTGRWANLTPSYSPTGRSSPAVAFDSESQRLVLFGGGPFTNDTWSFDPVLATWRDDRAVPGPAPNYAGEFAYDSQSDRLVFFGGISGWDYRNETWTYDHDRLAWAKMQPAVSPSPRWGHAMAYDVESDRVVLFGGYDAHNMFDETWTYDLEADRWQLMRPVVSPPYRAWTAAAYEADSDRILVFGGVMGGLDLNDTWAYDFNGDSWEDVKTASSPPARAHHGLAHDVAADRTVLFGGQSLKPDTWVYDHDNRTWTEMAPSTLPPWTSYARLVYHPGLAKVVLPWASTMPPPGVMSATWLYDVASNVWSEWTPGPSPPARYQPALGYDAGSDAVIMFAGDAGGAKMDDVWVFSSRIPAPSAPLVLRAERVAENVMLTWTAPPGETSLITGYRIQRTENQSGAEKAFLLGPVTEYLDRSASVTSSYEYSIASVGPGGESALSEPARVGRAADPPEPESPPGVSQAPVPVFIGGAAIGVGTAGLMMLLVRFRRKRRARKPVVGKGGSSKSGDGARLKSPRHPGRAVKHRTEAARKAATSRRR